MNLTKENKMIFLLFVLSTAWFLYQHYIYINWDFAAYVLNAKYWFAGGSYFELIRPPLTPLIIGIFSFIGGWKVSEYLYVLFVAILFLFSSLKLADTLNFNRLFFYALSLNVYVLLIGTMVGTELLSLCLLEIFISYFLAEKQSGHFLALAILTRYNILSMLPLLIYHKNLKIIIKDLVLFSLAWSPWLLYNLVNHGNAFASLLDNFALNIAGREHTIHQTFNLLHILSVTNFLTPFFILGLFKIFSLLLKEKNGLVNILLRRKIEVTMLFVLASTIYSYNSIPIKDPRFLFSMTIPTFYFSYIGIDSLPKKIRRYSQVFVYLLVIVSLLISFCIQQMFFVSHDVLEIYKDSIERLNSLGFSNCSLMSNNWVFLNYLGGPSKPNPTEDLVTYYLGEGETMVFFREFSYGEDKSERLRFFYEKIYEAEYARNQSFFQNLPVVYESSNYTILGNLTTCKKI